ncbi:MAG: 5-formyltetrahydrofolate cyclo-ligase [Candidatus Midichloriaceae bacterium]|jgi:5-formyltetrahydrofolate cyclo-ligase
MNGTLIPKKKLRERLIKKRGDYDKYELDIKSQLIYKNFFHKVNEEYIKTNNIIVIAGYFPIKNEVNILPILEELRNIKVVVCLPKIFDNDLKFCEWKRSDILIKNKFQIKEPEIPIIRKPDLVIVPVVGFDENHNRLGYGSGYYDRALSSMNGVIKLGVAYDFQKVTSIPKENHDIKLDIMITDVV